MRRFIATLTAERSVRHISFWWGLAEGLFFFIVPDVYILFVALFAPARGWRAWGYSIVGSVISVVIMWGLYGYTSLDVMAYLTKIPAISPDLLVRVTEETGRQGLPYSPFLVIGGVPLKVYTVAAFATGYSVFGVLLWTLFFRIVRIGPGYVVAFVLSRVFRRSIGNHPGWWIGIYLTIWITIYSFYFSKMGF